LIRIGVVGAGAWGSTHLKRLLQYSDKLNIEVVGFYDINPERASFISRTLGIRSLDLSNLLNSVDGLIVATPPTTHSKIASKAIEKGITLLVEKPFATSMEDANTIHKLSKKFGVDILVGYIERFNPVVRELRRILTSQDLGSPVVISSKRVGPRGRRIRDVGVILDLATHDIDIARFILGSEPNQLLSMYGSKHGEYEDYAILTLKFGDTTVLIETNLLTPYKVRTIYTTCTDGVIYGDYIRRSIKISTENYEREKSFFDVEPLVEEHKHFVNVIRGIEKPICTVEDAISVLKVALEALKKPGKLITL